jgi:hypothetical protein
MTLQIRFDQTGLPAGVPGEAREDIVLGTPVSATAIGGPYHAYRWAVAAPPLNVDTDTRSTVAPASPSSTTTQLTPIDVEGTYLIEVAVDSGYGIGAREEDVARLTFYAGSTLATYPGDLPVRIPAAGERREHNAGGNQYGWEAALRRWFRVVEAISRGRAWASARVLDDPSIGPTVIRGNNVATGTGSVSWSGGSSQYTITFQRGMADGNYGVLLTPFASTGRPDVAIPKLISTSTGSAVVAFFDAAGSRVRQSFTMQAILRV